MLIRAAILAGMLAVPAVGGAKAAGSGDWLGAKHVSALAVIITDEVRDGCWPRPSATREAVELVFLGAGLNVAVDGAGVLEATAAAAMLRAMLADAVQPVEWAHILEISAIGYEPPGRSGLCTVSLSFNLFRWEPLHQPRVAGPVQDGWRGGLLTGSKSRMQGHITETVTELATSLANAILRSRAAFPEERLTAEPYTVEQYRDAARRALEAGDVDSARKLIAAGRRAQAAQQAPEGPWTRYQQRAPEPEQVDD